ncbi:MAG: hypothetical protein V1778_00460 [bacterium]
MPNDINVKDNKQVSQDDKLLAALSYLWILSIVIYLIKRDRPFVHFHAQQGVVLWIVSIIFWFIPFLGWFLNLLVLILVIVGFVMAINGNEWKIPGVSAIAEKIKL